MPTLTYTLDQWLVVATKGLGNWAKSRIEGEITAHYDEAYRVALDAGDSEAQAGTVALESLGCAREAQARFQETQLSVVEERVLTSNACMSAKQRGLLTLFMVAGYIGFTIWWGGLEHPYFMLSLGIYCAIIFWSQQRLFRGYTRYLIVDDLMVLPCYLVLLQPFNSMTPASPLLVMVSITSFVIVVTVRYFFHSRRMFRIMCKLPKRLSEHDIQFMIDHRNVRS